MALGENRPPEVGGDIPRLGEVDAVPAHFRHDVFPENDDFLSTRNIGKT
jgi:hypothetical protein